MSFDYPYAGMILPDLRDLSPGPYLDSAAEVLTRIDPRTGRSGPVLRQHGCVFGRQLGIAVTPEEQSDYGPRVVLEVVTLDGAPPDDAEAAQLLSETVVLALQHSSSDILEWYAPDVLIDSADFLRLKGLVSPRRLTKMSKAAENALFANDAAVQAICGTLYPVPGPTMPAALDGRAPRRRSGLLARLAGLGRRRPQQIAMP
jgi:hypothetical protein